MKNSRFLINIFAFALIAMSLAGCSSSENTQINELPIPDLVSYNFDIRPILSDKCSSCHGPDANKRQAGLRLDDSVSVFKALKEHPNAFALVPGKPDLSEVFLRITTEDTIKMMPPKSSHLKLSSREVDLIERWIKQGAKYEKHNRAGPTAGDRAGLTVGLISDLDEVSSSGSDACYEVDNSV